MKMKQELSGLKWKISLVRSMLPRPGSELVKVAWVCVNTSPRLRHPARPWSVCWGFSASPHPGSVSADRYKMGTDLRKKALGPSENIPSPALRKGVREWCQGSKKGTSDLGNPTKERARGEGRAGLCSACTYNCVFQPQGVKSSAGGKVYLRAQPL